MCATFHYFAYGSNMHTGRLKARAPSATKICTARVAGYRLTWDKVSSDGSGKCHLETTGCEADEVWGVLFIIDSSEAGDLDRAEGLGHGYRKETILTLPAIEPLPVAYIATQRDTDLKPYRWYRRLVIAGAEEHHLPESYIAALRTVALKPGGDDVAGAAEALRLLGPEDSPS